MFGQKMEQINNDIEFYDYSDVYSYRIPNKTES